MACLCTLCEDRSRYLANYHDVDGEPRDQTDGDDGADTDKCAALALVQNPPDSAHRLARLGCHARLSSVGVRITNYPALIYVGKSGSFKGYDPLRR